MCRYKWNVCGNVNAHCFPLGYNVEYQRGVAIQYFGDSPPTGLNCTDQLTGKPVQCTEDCEVLAVGPPTFSLADPTKPQGFGINITHYGVPGLYVFLVSHVDFMQ
jgi:hypothetical protein